MGEIQNNNRAISTSDAPVKLETARMRRSDNGSATLAHMENFVRLTRRIKRTALLDQLVAYANATAVMAASSTVDNDGSGKALSLALRDALFARVAELESAAQLRLEQAAERVTLLCDEFGALAVAHLLDPRHPEDAQILAAPTDKFSRALYLYLKQEGPVAGNEDRRFDHAEARQEMLSHAQSEKYSSHYLGPKGAQPQLDAHSDELLKSRLAALFAPIDAKDIVIERFVRRDENAIVLYTLSASFNGSRVHFQQVTDGEIRDHDEPAVTNLQYSWQPDKGTLGVYCDVKTARSELAAIFRDVMLRGNGDIRSMPMREFDLVGFSSATMLERSKIERIEGVDSISIQHIVVAKPQLRQMVVRGKEITRVAKSDLRIRRHRFEDRNIYQIVSDNKMGDLADYQILGVRLSFGLARQSHRRAHSTSIEITVPNGFSDRSKTGEDSEIILAQLTRLGCARQY